jgi:hypothetical protein
MRVLQDLVRTGRERCAEAARDLLLGHGNAGKAQQRSMNCEPTETVDPAPRAEARHRARAVMAARSWGELTGGRRSVHAFAARNGIPFAEARSRALVWTRQAAKMRT